MHLPRRFADAIVFAAWLMFIGSFFLPATNVLEVAGTSPGTPLTGWQAFTSIQILGWHPIIIIAMPRSLLFLACPIANLAMLLAPLVVLAWSIEAWPFSGLFVLSGIVPWFIPKEMTGDLFVGFYLWDASFFAMALACILVSLSRRPNINATR